MNAFIFLLFFVSFIWCKDVPNEECKRMADLLEDGLWQVSIDIDVQASFKAVYTSDNMGVLTGVALLDETRMVKMRGVYTCSGLVAFSTAFSDEKGEDIAFTWIGTVDKDKGQMRTREMSTSDVVDCDQGRIL